MSSSGATKRSPAYPDIFCVIVAYRPKCLDLNEKIRRLSEGFHVVVVSNADNRDTELDFAEQIDAELCTKLPLGANRGIGAAQNIGVAHALASGAKHILLLDDDSEITNADVVALMNRYVDLSRQGLKVGAIATAVVDAESSSNIVHKLDVDRPYTLIRDLMSSGTLIPAEVFRVVGPMREDLFIDCVDFEWGWRCLQHGLSLVVENQVKIRHRLGQSRVNCIGSVSIRVPAPIRHYYQFRNVIALTLFGRPPMAWRLRHFLSLFLKLPIYLLLLNGRRERAKYMFAGIFDGFRNKLGKYA